MTDPGRRKTCPPQLVAEAENGGTAAMRPVARVTPNPEPQGSSDRVTGVLPERMVVMLVALQDALAPKDAAAPRGGRMRPDWVTLHFGPSVMRWSMRRWPLASWRSRHTARP